MEGKLVLKNFLKNKHRFPSYNQTAPLEHNSLDVSFSSKITTIDSQSVCGVRRGTHCLLCLFVYLDSKGHGLPVE